MLTLPRTVARIASVAVAALLGVVATQLLVLGFESEPLLSVATVEAVVRWIGRRPLSGAGILGGIVLVGAGMLVLLGALAPANRPPTIATRRRDGWTRVDRSSLEAALDRQLATIDPTADVSAAVRRSGRVDLEVDTLDTAADGPTAKIRSALDELLDERGLPCRAGTITVKPRRATRRSRPRLR